MICFNPDPLVTWGLDGTNLTHPLFGNLFFTNGKRSVFSERSVRVPTEEETVHVRHNFDLRSLVIAKCGLNGSEEIAGR